MPPLLFAFGIAHLPMLGWLAAAAAPILIHLWSRRRHGEMYWAAMEYLLAAVKRQNRRLRIERWLLLAVRTLLVVLVVVAVAEPYSRRFGFVIGAGGRAHRVLVIDGSYSMGYRAGDKTLFDRAKQLARQVVEESRAGDAFTLVSMSSPPRAVVAKPAQAPKDIVREIDNLRLSHAGADLPAAVAMVRQIVDGARREDSRLSRSEVYFFSDMQRVTWAPKLSARAAAEFLEQTTELVQAAALCLIDLSQPAAENLAVTELRSTEHVFIVGRDLQLEAVLKNLSHQAFPRQPVELFVERRRVERKEVDISPGETAAVKFSCRLDSPGDHAIEVRAVGDTLEVDNHRFLAAPARQAIQTLCIDGRPAGQPFRGAADYLALALAPQTINYQKDLRPLPASLIQVEIAAESGILERNLNDYDCVFLCNVAQFTASEARALDAYLRAGGSLAIFLGDRVLADRYNNALGVAGQDETGRPHLLPAQIGPIVERPQLHLDPLGYRHPILQPFRGRGQNSLLNTPVFKHYKLTMPKNSPTKTVLALSDGDPLLVEAPIQQGRVVLAATSAEPSWTAMPLLPSFLPLVQEIAAYCVRGQFQRRNLLVGDFFRATGGADSSQSGVFVAKSPPPAERAETYAVNVDTAESDLTPIDLDELQDDVWPDVPFVRQTSWQEHGGVGSSSPVRSDGRLHVVLLYAAFGLLLADSFLAWQYGRR